MELIDNISRLLGDDLKQTIRPGARLKIAASCFSMYAYEALKSELEKIDELDFIFTSPTFVADEVTDKIRKERREFHIPKLDRERSLYGSEFEIQLRNQLTQKAVARECADWMRRKAKFRSNRSKAPMQQFACVEADGTYSAYVPLHGFTAVDLGYSQGNAVSNLVNKVEAPFANTYLSLFDQIWNDPEKLEDVTAQICEHIASVYQENSPESIYFLMLYNIFNEFLDDIDEDVLPNDRTGYQDTLIWNKLFNYQRDVVTGTGDDNVISAQANDMAYRKEQLRRLQEEVIELEDLKTGVSITDLGLNDFRMDLLNYVKAHGELHRSPNGLHAVVPANPDLGLAPGVIFTLRNRSSGVNPPAHLPQHNRLHPYYLVYISQAGEVIHDHTEVKRLLDLARSCCKGQAEPIADACQQFNKTTADGRKMQAYSDLLNQAIRSMIEVKEEKDLDSLFTGGKTTALTGTISGLDDFELISFLVIQEVG